MFWSNNASQNTRFVLLLLCVMVHSGVAFHSGVIAHDIMGSTAFNVAMFAMGWAATRWASGLKGKGNEPSFGLHWIKAMATVPLALLPPRTPAASDVSSAADAGDVCAMAGPPLLLAQENEDATTLLAGLNALLADRITAADTAVSPPWRRSSCFHSNESSSMQLNDYLAHVHWFFECSSPCLVIALIYLDRALSKCTKVSLSTETCHRLVLTSLVAALKFHDDDWTPYPNAFYASIGEVGVEDLNAMEKQFCKSIDWHFYVRPEEYLHYRGLIAAAAPTTSAS